MDDYCQNVQKRQRRNNEIPTKHNTIIFYTVYCFQNFNSRYFFQFQNRIFALIMKYVYWYKEIKNTNAYVWYSSRLAIRINKLLSQSVSMCNVRIDRHVVYINWRILDHSSGDRMSHENRIEY